MDLTSPDFEEDAPIPREHTCDGPDTPPELHWSGVPSGVVELALTCEDPDAPGGTFVHWVAWGIDPSSGRLRADDGPRIGQGRNGFGSDGYHGPCPPPGHGPHSYEFRLTALDESLDLAPGSAIEDLRSAIDGHVRATATLMGTYER
ncbi:MAG TPA: YbhB/YbcL family Raf kinase inhibitor-like protein [Acidimicrobiia bacterium]|nr:YbhB/YbcL family Raf kinase inhibitor-like protein [Acidimicrobiia bacterium]